MSTGNQSLMDQLSIMGDRLVEMQTERDQLRAKLAKAEKDSERLDWVEQNVSGKNPRFAHDVYATWDADKSLRQAIDAAAAKATDH